MSNVEATVIKSALTKYFTLKGLGDARFVLGIEVNSIPKRGFLHICQSQFIERLAERLVSIQRFPAVTPNVFGQNMSEFTGGEKIESKKYRELIGSLTLHIWCVTS